MGLRYTEPGRFDYEKFGSICRAVRKDNKVITYIQLSQDKDHPKWTRMGHFLETVFKRELVKDGSFLKSCLTRYEDITYDGE